MVRAERLKIVDPQTRKPITQTEAARRARLSRTHWSRVEGGSSGIKPETVIAFARALNRTGKTEIDEVHIRAGFTTANQIILPPSIARFEQLSPEAQEDVARLVQRLYDGEQAQRTQLENANKLEEIERIMAQRTKP